VENRQVAGVVLVSDVDYAVPHADLRLARDTGTSTLRARLACWRLDATSRSDRASVRSATTSVAGPPALDVLGNPKRRRRLRADEPRRELVVLPRAAARSRRLARSAPEEKGGTLAHEARVPPRAGSGR